MENISVADLYLLLEQELKRGKGDYTILVQYRDDGGEYTGKDRHLLFEVDNKKKTITL